MSVQNFITNFNGGTRKNRFRVSCNIPGFTIPTPPAGDPTDRKPEAVASAAEGFPSSLGAFDDFHVLAAAMPASILTTNPIDFRGRKILYPGDRIYSADGFNVWTVTIQDDIKGGSGSGSQINNLWGRLHLWCNGINSHGKNTGNTTSDSESDIVVRQLNLNGTRTIKQCTLKNAWPQSVGPIDMEMQARDQYNSFEVTFCFKYVVYQDLDQGQ
jgi:hypothetical protein